MPARTHAATLGAIEERFGWENEQFFGSDRSGVAKGVIEVQL